MDVSCMQGWYLFYDLMTIFVIDSKTKAVCQEAAADNAYQRVHRCDAGQTHFPTL